MKHIRFKEFWIVSLISTVLYFLLLYGGTIGILNKTPPYQDILSYGVLSILFGILAGAFYAIRFRITFWLYISGILVGFFSMYSQYLSFNVREDADGMFYLLICSGIGLASGFLVELVWYLIIQSRKKRSK